MNNKYIEGTKVKLVGRTYESFNRYFNDFDNKNEWEVVGIGKLVKQANKHLILIKSCHNLYNNQIMQFFEEDLEEL